MLSPIVRDVQMCAMYKDNAVGNVVAETGRDLVFMTRLSDLSMPLKGEVRRSPEQSARQPIRVARSGKFVQRAYSRRTLGCEKTAVLLSPIVEHTGAHFCLRGAGGS